MSSVRVVVDSRIRLLLVDLGPDRAERICELHEHKNPAHEKLKRMGMRFDHRKEPKYIKTWRLDGPWLSLPRGGMARTREFLAGDGVTLRIRDDRTEGSDRILGRGAWAPYQRTLYPDQEEAKAVLLERETCYLRAPTGAGKTEICLAVIAEIRRPAIILVWTGALFDQWIERIEAGLGIRRRDIGQVRGGKKTAGRVTVGMQQSVAKIARDDVFWDLFGVIVADELQRFSAPTFIESVDPFRARYRIGASADERRADKKEFLAHDLFGDLALSIARTELVEKKRVRDVEVRVEPTGWFPSLESTQGRSGDVYRRMLDEMSDSEERDALILRIVEEERARGEQVLVFSLRVEHCRRLVGRLASAGVTAGLMLGGAENRLALTEAVEGMRAGTMRVAVGTVQAVGTGVDLPSVGVGIVAQPVASNKQLFGQVAGRICRIAGGDGPARLYYLLDACRAKDWSKLFDDARPVFVRCPDGSWIDARHDRRAAKLVALPKEDRYGGFSDGDVGADED